MWERLFEFALFVRSGGTHRKPTEILKSFLKSKESERLSKEERRKLRAPFVFLAEAYRTSDLGATRLATDQTHFYTMVTALLASDLLNLVDLKRRLLTFSKLLAAPGHKVPTDDERVARYLELSSKQTTDADKRRDRQQLFVDLIRSF
jgi:hypothetical protein